MLNYIIRRLLLVIPTLIGVTAVVFFVMAASPGGVGGPALSMTGEVKSDQRKAMMDYYDKRYRLKDPIVLQYFRWLNHVSPIGTFTRVPEGTPFPVGARPSAGIGFNVSTDEDRLPVYFGFKVPDLGESFQKRRSVTALYSEALPITLLLNVVTTPIVYILSIWIGIAAAKRRGKMFDSVSSTTVLGLSSIPTNLMGVLLIGYLANAHFLHWFPSGGLHSLDAASMPFFPRWNPQGFERGYFLDLAWHLTLPVFCLTYGSFAFVTKLTRASVLDNLASDFARTARAKGVSGSGVLYRHVFRNSLIPLITISAGILPGLIGGSLILEQIFSIPGMGKLGIEAVFTRDREVILAGTLVGGLLGLLCRLAADVSYTIADPRVSYE